MRRTRRPPRAPGNFRETHTRSERAPQCQFIIAWDETYPQDERDGEKGIGEKEDGKDFAGKNDQRRAQ